MAQNQQQEFVEELLDRNDQVFGIRLTLNKFLILFLKCLYIRKQRKIITLFELFIPPLIFFFAIKMADDAFRFAGWKRPNNTDSGSDNPRFISQLDDFPEDLFYYDYGQNVNGPKLEEFLKNALDLK